MTGQDSIEYATLTDVGIRRSHNQDAYAAFPATDVNQWQTRGHFFLVADGMGAHAVGELASKLAADHIPHLFSKYVHEGPVAALRRAFVEANLTIHTRGQKNREFEGMGTTATAILLRPEGVWVGHVGDSRCYRVRDGFIQQLSFDHSLLWEMARRQRKNPDQLQGIPHNVIIRSLGPEPLVQVDVEGPHPIQAGDRFVLCSDGLSGPVSDREIGAVVSALPPAEACRFLVHLANMQGGPDNITAVVVHVPGTPSSAAGQTSAANGLQVWSGPTRTSVLVSKLRRLPWPIVSLFLGIVLASAAIVLRFQEQPGSIPAFLLAAIALLLGLAGLLWQFQQHQQKPPEEHQPRLHVYRQTACDINETVLQRLATAVTSLEKRIRDNGWEADWDGCNQHVEAGQHYWQEGRLAEAFAEHCRAVQLLMEVLERQRGKEEFFKPLWDSPGED